MFILFGFGKKTIKDFNVPGEILCRRCNNKRHWVYKKVTTWFTLFFIPVIPYKVEYVRVCPICGEYDQMKKDAFMALAQGEVIVDINSSEEPIKQDYTGMTETQANYMKEMAAFKAAKDKNSEL